MKFQNRESHIDYYDPENEIKFLHTLNEPMECMLYLSFKIYYFLKIIFNFKIKEFELEAFLNQSVPWKEPFISFFLPLNIPRMQEKFELIKQKPTKEEEEFKKIQIQKRNRFKYEKILK